MADPASGRHRQKPCEPGFSSTSCYECAGSGCESTLERAEEALRENFGVAGIYRLRALRDS
jgi:hypothetical protein